MAEQIRIDRDVLDQAVELITSHVDEREAGRREGAEQATHGYERGFSLGHDTGFGARQDTRTFVAGLLAGLDAGNREREELARSLIAQSRERKQPELDYNETEIEL